MQPDKRKQLLVAVFGFCLLAYAMDSLVLEPLIQTWKDRSARIVELDLQLEKAQLVMDNAANTENRWKAVNASALPADPATAEHTLLPAINERAADAGVHVTSLNPRWVDDDNLGRRLEVRVTGDSGLRAAGKFLHAVETDPLPLRLESLELRATDDKGAKIVLDARFTALTAAKDPEPVAASTGTTASPAAGEDDL